jgi:hypothetical protein
VSSVIGVGIGPLDKNMKRIIVNGVGLLTIDNIRTASKGNH